MRRIVQMTFMACLAAEVLAAGQGRNIHEILAAARQALGGDQKLSAVTSITGTGTLTRAALDTSTTTDYDFALQLPDKFVEKQALAQLGTTTISRTSGFNGDELIETIDQPPSLGGGAMVFRMGPGLTPPGSAPLTADQAARAKKAGVLSNKQLCTKLVLGMLAAPLPTYPLEFTDKGVAESPDGKADVVGVTGEGDFDVTLFIDQQSHLPLMLSWMAKEPLVLTSTNGGPTGGAGGATVTQRQFSNPNAMTPEQRAQFLKDMDEERKEADAKRKIVEYRMYYADYRDVDGVKMPHTISRSIAGQPSDEITFEKIKINPKIDPKRFAVKQP